MKVGDVITIKGTNTFWDGKQARIEAIDEEKNVATTLVDFIPDENKRIRQDFSLNILEDCNIMTESLTEDDDIDLENDELQLINNIITDLAEYFNVDVEDVEHKYGNVFEVNGDEYWVGDYDKAYDAAVANAREALDELGLEALSPDYKDYVINKYLDEDSCNDIIKEYYEGYISDIEDESDYIYGNRLIEEMYKAGILTDDDFESDDEDIYYDRLKDNVDIDSKKGEFIEYLASDTSAYQFLEDLYGNGEELTQFISENDLIDFDDVAEDCVDTDGIAHFLASYDGKEIEVNDYLYAYRL